MTGADFWLGFGNVFSPATDRLFDVFSASAKWRLGKHQTKKVIGKYNSRLYFHHRAKEGEREKLLF